MKTAVVRFPGSNCEQDCYHVSKEVFKQDTDHIWHKESFDEKKYDLVILPGGFSYGDYLRSGAIAKFSPVMNSVIAYANRGGYVLGICNGFQILTESGLLPGALIKNVSLKFICKDVYLKVENAESDFTKEYSLGQCVRIPIAHGDGNYRADEELTKRLNGEGLVAFRYADENGKTDSAANPNGSVENIAGILSSSGRILGMMPHPERVSEAMLGHGEDGRALFASIFSDK